MSHSKFAKQTLESYRQALVADCAKEFPKVQLAESEIDSLVELLGTVLEAGLKTPGKTVKHRAPSAYQVWKSDDAVKAAFRQANPGCNGPLTNKLMGQLWKAMSEADKKPFVETSEQKKRDFISPGEKSDQEDTKVPSKPSKAVKTDKTVKAKTTGERKRARTAFMLFKMDEAVKAKIKSDHPEATTFAELQTLYAAAWKAKTDEEKQPYQDKSDAEKALFEKAATTKADETKAIVQTAQILAEMATSQPKAEMSSQPQAEMGQPQAEMGQPQAEMTPPQTEMTPPQTEMTSEAKPEIGVEAEHSSQEESSQEPVVVAVVSSGVSSGEKPRKSRGSSPYQTWKKVNKKQYQLDHSELDGKELSASMKAYWDSMSAEDKQPYVTMAKQTVPVPKAQGEPSPEGSFQRTHTVLADQGATPVRTVLSETCATQVLPVLASQ